MDHTSLDQPEATFYLWGMLKKNVDAKAMLTKILVSVLFGRKE